ncbi:MAG: hypothetical protein A2428_02870 [Bdellovibrionales bacterium RIFOXYC1_FULL_54_43]|nr:MAG: hypothetical protein A2428_02870 [Bdellovibrionales bacterium RIFOXYC1_FULL_54_43]OFZ83447.1 MAG: hypothetical protein A2603_03415 [Bdellovibrionales bacterium RIFOXYD1_FULL_55_31]
MLAQKRTLIIVLQDNAPVLKQLADLVKKDETFEVGVCRSLGEVHAHFTDEKKYFVLYAVSSVDDLKRLVPFTKMTVRQIAQGHVALVALNRLGLENAPMILKAMGFADVISSVSIKATGLRRRLESLSELLNRPRQENVDQKPVAESAQQLVSPLREIHVLEPLTIASDCWLLRSNQDAKKIKDQWVVNLMGPGPPAGHWERRNREPVVPDGDNMAWEWRPNDAKDGTFVEPGGSWIFQGKRPLFAEFHWIFISKLPKLSYFLGGKEICDYFTLTEDGNLSIRANSEIAKKKWPAIHASILNEYRVGVQKFENNSPVRFFKNTENKGRQINNKIGEDEPATPWRNLMGLSEPGPEWKNQLTPDIQNNIEQLKKDLNAKQALFSRIANPGTRFSYVRELEKSHLPAVLWTAGQKIKFSAKIERFDQDSDAVILQAPAGDDARQLVSEDASGQVFVNISLHRGSLFFVTNRGRIQIEGACLRIPMPETLYEVQRRSHFRLPIPAEKLAFAVVAGQMHPLLNLSGGGMALMVKGSDKDRFAQGTILEDVGFDLCGTEIHCAAEVRWVKPDANGSNFTIGIQFKDLDPMHQQKISLYVLEEGFGAMSDETVS